MKKKMLTIFVLLATAISVMQAKQAIDGAAGNAVNFATHDPAIVEHRQITEPVRQEIAAQEATIVTVPRKLLSRMYIGLGSGVSFGRSTFASFAMDKTHPGFNANVLGGYRINKLVSAEVSLDYTRMKLGTYDCCQNLWLGEDGNRYFAPLSGMKSYKYSNLTSTTNLLGLGAHLNINLLSIWIQDSKWSAFVSPAIYGVYSNADVKLSGTEVRTASKFHFGTGIDLGVGYMINPKVSLRLTTGINYLTGAIDALPREEHKTTYMWNSGLKLIYKL